MKKDGSFFGLLALVLLFLAGTTTVRADNELEFAIGILFALAGCFSLPFAQERQKRAALGIPMATRFLKPNEIYETIGEEVVYGDTHYVVLRRRDGDVRTYLFAMTPPPVFQWVDKKPAPYPAPREVSSTS
ncbi:MAG: hypothetical protein HY435_01330 [Candidatus Liptonbacteria bacterium]|nr:hypothetical protein [Candidatus Liptonbacteria bacterium]